MVSQHQTAGPQRNGVQTAPSPAGTPDSRQPAPPPPLDEHDGAGWANAIGTLSILLGIQSVLDVVPWMFWHGNELRFWAVPFWSPSVEEWTAAVQVAGGAVLVVAGLLLRARRRAGVVLHVAWGLLMVPLVSAAPLVMLPPVTGALLRGQQAFPATLLYGLGLMAMLALIDAAYAGFVLLWFSRRSIRQQVASWSAPAGRGTIAEPATPRTGGPAAAIVPAGLGVTTSLWTLRSAVACFLGPLVSISGDPGTRSPLEWGVLCLEVVFGDLSRLAWFPLLVGVPLAVAGIGIYRGCRWGAWVMNAGAAGVCLTVLLVACFELSRLERLHTCPWSCHVLVHHVVVVGYLSSLLWISAAHAVRQRARRSAGSPNRA